MPPLLPAQLVKFRQLFESRYCVTLTLADLGRMRDVVEVEEGDPAGGRVVRLVAGPGKAVAAAAETAHCEVHWPAGRQAGDQCR